MDRTERLITEFDRALRTLTGVSTARRPSPAEAYPEAELPEAARRHAAALMRVNHCGEVCAQALYQGQALSARNATVEAALRRAADEEQDHLSWSAARIRELGGRPSLLNPLWYAGSFLIGFAAGRAGDAWNLGFLRETERQVEAHLQSHVERLPAADHRTQAVITQMQREEAGHAATAQRLGARTLPSPLRLAMKAASRVMTGVSYWL